MRQFGIALAVLSGLCLISGGCEAPKKARPASTEYGDYGRDLVKKGRAPREDFSSSDNATTSQSEGTVVYENYSIEVVADSTDSRTIQSETMNEAAPVATGSQGGEGFRENNGGVISYGFSKVGRDAKSGSNGSLSAVSPQ